MADDREALREAIIATSRPFLDDDSNPDAAADALLSGPLAGVLAERDKWRDVALAAEQAVTAAEAEQGDAVMEAAALATEVMELEDERDTLAAKVTAVEALIPKRVEVEVGSFIGQPFTTEAARVLADRLISLLRSAALGTPEGENTDV